MFTDHRPIERARPTHRPMTARQETPEATARETWRSRFLALQLIGLDSEAFTLADFALWHTLEEHICHGGEVLDLSAHGDALGRAADELMEAFADACRLFERRAKVLHLPAGLSALPSWVDAFPWVERIMAPGAVDAPTPQDA
ncbi:MAG: hypothetical protein GTN84_05930 [Hydrogenophaga sp.]|uniref:hypothetical protein n=1 Tax=Hydrogenophaga sp. TaxID=1904254 RepID=UPI0016B39A6D|nr:hypothetical protein [Hydrogenophaga sp.]NIM40531.1 hypothetical protein [Hydrogenophaga sp.]NIN25949.1 hypothetical protein [Hydrogenophaga sp.]NIN30821.1 hypothetical protein [Hydrogenophaga sp.]NIN54914.1 hypothetical protein [Hydrogenophaga sp.]NIO50954.1 hypothetical protein [Hydrogenophaga sp.]